MYDYHPDLVCILFVRSHPYILYIFKKCFLLLVIIIHGAHYSSYLMQRFVYLQVTGKRWCTISAGPVLCVGSAEGGASLADPRSRGGASGGRELPGHIWCCESPWTGGEWTVSG